MHLIQNREARPIESEQELADYFLAACKPRERFRVGMEYELIGVHDRAAGGPPGGAGAPGGAVGTAPPYEGARGIGTLLESLTSCGWEPIREGSNIIALVRGDEQIAIEPGGQLEHAARPCRSGVEFERDAQRYLSEIAGVSRQLGIAWLGVGFRPFGRIEDVSWMPKQRYRIMRDYLPARGRLAPEMMKRTATVQASLDFSDAADAGRKLRCIMSVTSLLTAIYASSPVVDGRLAGVQSYRSLVWRETDPARCGLLPFVFASTDPFHAYAQWALDVPMFFVHRGGYVPVADLTFRRFLREGWDGHRATMDDWELHLSTLFPEARLKRVIEVRGCDVGHLGMIRALGPLCRGLLYDDDACAAATALTAGLDMDQREALRESTARLGFQARVGERRVGELCTELVSIAAAALRRQAPDELHYLEPLQAIVDQQVTQADRLTELWQRTGGEPAAVIDALRVQAG